jgi:hypothetical protein
MRSNGSKRVVVASSAGVTDGYCTATTHRDNDGGGHDGPPMETTMKQEFELPFSHPS